MRAVFVPSGDAAESVVVVFGQVFPAGAEELVVECSRSVSRPQPPLHAGGGATEIARAAGTASVASHFSARVAPILLLLTLSTLPLSRVHSVSASVAGAQPVLYASSRDSEDRALLEDITESPAAALLALPPGERQWQESLQRLEDERLEQCRAARMFDTCFFFGTAGPTAERATARAGEGRASQPQSQGGRPVRTLPTW